MFDFSSRDDGAEIANTTTGEIVGDQFVFEGVSKSAISVRKNVEFNVIAQCFVN